MPHLRTKTRSCSNISWNECAPEIGDGDAYEGRAENCPTAVHEENTDHDIAEFDDFGGSEDPFVLEYNGDFTKEEGEVVGWYRCPEALVDGINMSLTGLLVYGADIPAGISAPCRQTASRRAGRDHF